MEAATTSTSPGCSPQCSQALKGFLGGLVFFNFCLGMALGL